MDVVHFSLRISVISPTVSLYRYEVKEGLKIHSQRAPVKDWIEWRDGKAMSQIGQFAKFVDYWMERFLKSNNDRIFISYETLTDDNDGAEEATRINNFLAQSDGVEPIATEAVPCVWRTVVKYKGQAAPFKRRLDDGRRRLDPAHHDSQRKGPTERPYTLEMLNAMSHMLLGLVKRWGDHHLRLRQILEGYHRDVHAAYLAVSSQANEQPPPQLQQPPQSNNLQQPAKNFHIFQVSLGTTGSTILNNLLVGLFDPGADFKQSSMITKTQDTDLLTLYKKERPSYDDVFFVGTGVGKETCEYDNVVCIEDKELQYSNQQELRDMVDNLSDKLQLRFAVSDVS